MPCFHPVHGYYSDYKNPSGKRDFVFTKPKGSHIVQEVTRKCGQCVGCRLEYSRQWAMRCHFEASIHKDNCFITLTYDQEHLPENYGIHRRDVQLFFKKLRRKYHKGKDGEGIKYYYCGEYGEKTSRPHYHAIIFNHDWSDKELFSIRDNIRLYTSSSLQKLWPKGFVTTGSCTFESSAYVARYVMKKHYGKDSNENYEWVNMETGQIYDRDKEFVGMSNGIAEKWFQKYKNDVYPHDYVILRDKKMKPPKYFDNLYDIENPEKFQEIKAKRTDVSQIILDNNTPDRLKVREHIQKHKIEKLTRKL